MITSAGRHAQWAAGSIVAGRGASKHHLSAQAVPTQNDPVPFDYNFPFSRPSLGETSNIPLPPSRLRSKNPPRRTRSSPGTAGDEPRQRAEKEQDDLLLPEQEPRDPNSGLEPRLATSEATLAEATSGQVHILGSNPRGTLVAHALAQSPALPPVRLLIHEAGAMRAWRREGERLAVRRDDEWSTSERAVAEWVGRQGWKPKADHIRHLVVSLPCVATIKAIASIRHRIDSRTTICLLQDGLGLIEAVNAWCFPDPRSRPTYILGHMTHTVGFQPGHQHAALVRHPRKLYLHALGPNSRRTPPIRYHPPIERQARAVDFLRILTAAPGLNAEGATLQNFLLKKLPTMAAKSAVDPVTVVLECSYAEVLASPYGMRLVNQLLDEIYSVTMSLQELPNAAKIVKNVSRKRLWGDIQGRLRSKGHSPGSMQASMRRGETTDIAFLNGWFIKKGEELGIKCPANRMVVDMVKAKRRLYAAEAEAGDVQFEGL